MQLQEVKVNTISQAHFFRVTEKGHQRAQIRARLEAKVLDF